MTPVPRDDGHALFGAYFHLGIVVEAGDEVYVEREWRRGLHGSDVLAQQAWRREADADGADAAGPADGDGEVRRLARECHSGAGERVAYTEALRETGCKRRDGRHGDLLASQIHSCAGERVLCDVPRRGLLAGRFG